MIAGIDLSHNNGAIDYSQVASTGAMFAYLKASEGRFGKDARFTANYDGLRQNQIPCGAYHFYRPESDAEAQATNFLSVVSQLDPGDLPPALDVEIAHGQSATAIVAGIQQWLNVVQQNLGRAPVIYTSASFWNSAVAGSDEFAGNPLWVAHYTSNPAPNIPNGFSDYMFWQYSDSGQIDGINGKVDLDWYNGTLSDLHQLAGLGGG